jgi:acetyl-CoA C-acetyltransferase
VEAAVIVSAVRTPVGRFGGQFRDLRAATLGATAIRAALERVQVNPADVDEVVFGHVLGNGESPNVGRLAWLEAGLPMEVPAYSVDRQCGSGLQAIINAALLIQTGNADVVLAGGTESESQAEYYSVGARWGARLGETPFYDRISRQGMTVSCPEKLPPTPSMMHTSENLVTRYGITREQADTFSLRSQQHAARAIQEGRFDDELVPVAIPQRKGDPLMVDRDEHPRPETTAETLAKLPVLVGKIHTAGNASGINDGAAACVVMSEARARKLGLEPLGCVRAFAAAGVDPTMMGIGPAPAIRRALEKSGLRWRDLDLIEINEAFAAQVLAVLAELGEDLPDNLNVNGSGISLGHPLGATGARITATMLHELRRRGGRYGLVSMCTGGGQGVAAIFERPAA